MNKTTTIVNFLFIAVLFISCSNKKTLQSYLVETSGKEGFYTGDLPVSSILSAKAEVSEEVKETIKSIKKVNVAFLLKTKENDAAYETEKNILKDIFKDNDAYKSLMSMKTNGMNVHVFYSGDTDAIDEVIAFGYGKEAGVGVARLLGDNMNPAKIIEMLNSVQMDTDNGALQQFAKMIENK